MMDVQERIRRILMKDALVPVLEKGSVAVCLPAPSAADLRGDGLVWCWASQYEVGADVVNICSTPPEHG